MVRISDLSDDLLIKVLSFLPTKVVVSTSILSKQWEFLWMWLPKLKYCDYDITGPLSSYRDFIDQKLPLHRSPVIESLILSFRQNTLPHPERFKQWVEIAVFRFLRELTVDYYCFLGEPRDVLSLPSSLYTCNSLMTLKLQGNNILVDVPQVVCLPSLKTLKLQRVAYSNEDSLRLLLSHCPVLEDLLIVRAVTPSLKYFKIVDHSLLKYSYLIEPMPELEEADIEVIKGIEKVLKSVTSVRRLTLRASGAKQEKVTC
ncbi:unnamed protein product [Microthlaspi erraticum]|uniref:Uncharacterized protein n=1 Tax=Microthlaspi erraticum TaxID=1685480 RepID=A0A6D2K760_9BRAS|nr:unnamed protein product [Microthlaspi erraticum]